MLKERVVACRSTRVPPVFMAGANARDDDRPDGTKNEPPPSTCVSLGEAGGMRVVSRLGEPAAAEDAPRVPCGAALAGSKGRAGRARRVLVRGGLLFCFCALWHAGAVQAIELVTLPDQPSVWDRFTLKPSGIAPGERAGVQVRGLVAPRMAPLLTPMVGLGYENAHIASEWRGSWVEAARLGPLSIGAVASNDRLLALTASGSPREPLGREDRDSMRFGGFMAFADGAAELGRLAFTTGRLGGFDLKATRSFKLNDRVTLDIGPIISLGSFERFGYVSARSAAAVVSPDRAQLGAFGLTTAIEARLGERTVARMFAEYARIEAQRSGGAAVPNRDRVDFGLSLSTTINP